MKKNTYEVGRVTRHPLSFAVAEFMSVIRTWIYCKPRKIQTREWWGVYEAGTEHPIAKFGNMPGAKERAYAFLHLIETTDLEKKDETL